MNIDKQLLQRLEQLLSYKKSRQFYAKKLGISEREVAEMMEYIKTTRREKPDTPEQTLWDEYLAFEEDLMNGKGELTLKSKDEIKSLDELIEKCKIDTTKWKITKYVQNYWGNEKDPHWQVKAWLATKTQEETYQEEFIKFLTTYNPSPKPVPAPKFTDDKRNACLIINKQDAHFNRADFNEEDEDIFGRFDLVYNRIGTIVAQAELANNIEEIVYVLGSDAFNSEWTQSTTKGTPQDNILSYHDAFEAVCSHEIDMINLLLAYAKNVHIVFVPGNHDEYAGWHMVNWLQAYFRTSNRVDFEISPKYRKYVSYGKSAIMFNHGDIIKPERLAAIFPIEFKDNWSAHQYFYIFTGDKHIQTSHDFNGIEYYRLSALSTVYSKWEDKNGYLGRRPAATGFLIDEEYGMVNMFKQYL